MAKHITNHGCRINCKSIHSQSPCKSLPAVQSHPFPSLPPLPLHLHCRKEIFIVQSLMIFAEVFILPDGRPYSLGLEEAHAGGARMRKGRGSQLFCPTNGGWVLHSSTLILPQYCNLSAGTFLMGSIGSSVHHLLVWYLSL